MSDTNLLYKNTVIANREITASGVDVSMGSGVGKMILRATGSFRIASSAIGGYSDAYMVIPSGVAVEHTAADALIVSAPKAAQLQTLKYS